MAKKKNVTGNGAGDAERLPAKPRVFTKADVARAKQLTREILVLKQELERNAYEIGIRLREFQEKKLYLALKRRTFEDYLRLDVDDFERAAAYRYMQIAGEFDEKTTLDEGVAKLAAGLQYIKETPAKETPADIPTLTIPIRTEGGATRRKPFSQASVEEIRLATKREKEKNAKRLAKVTGKPLPDLAKGKRFLTTARAKLEKAGLDVKLAIEDGRLEIGIEIADLEDGLSILARAARPL